MRRGLMAALLVLALCVSGSLSTSASPPSQAQLTAACATSASAATDAIPSPSTFGSDASFAAISTWDGLRAQLAALVAGWDGQNAVSVTDLQTGKTISINGARPQLAACTIKIPIMMVVAHDIEIGRYSAAEVEPYVLSAMGPSNTAPARELLRYAGDGDIGVGINRVNELMQSLGMTHSVIAHPPGYYWESYGYGDENLLTSDDLNLLLLQALSRQGALPLGDRLRPLEHVPAPDWVNQSLGGPLPPDVTLYHKFGQLYDPENTWNDGGIAEFERDGTSTPTSSPLSAATTRAGNRPTPTPTRCRRRPGATLMRSTPASCLELCRTFATSRKPDSPPERFLRYWQSFGGLATFGYPISPRFKRSTLPTARPILSSTSSAHASNGIPAPGPNAMTSAWTAWSDRGNAERA